MKILTYIFILFIFCTFTAQAKTHKLVTDRETLCSLEFGKFKNNAYVASTPMEDACHTKDRKSRERICRFNYKKQEIINACMATYDAISFRIAEAKKSK